jgi:hypothetical protein
MMLVVNIFLIIILFIIFFQDMKQREISWILVPALFLGFIAKGFLEKGEVLLKNGMFNVAFVLIQLILLSIYMSIKNKKLTNIINTYLGIGDVLFFIAITAAFSPMNYVLFYVSSIILTLFGFILYKLIKQNAKAEIPLAGSMAGMMMIVICWSMIKPVNFYNDGVILNLFVG